MRKIVLGLGLALGILGCINVYAANKSTQQIAESMLKDIGQATWIQDGKGPHVVYVFFDPNCPYCHKLYVNSRKWVKDGKVQLRWVTVGVLTTTSAGKAAAILGAKDPSKAFHYNEENYSRGGAIEEDIPSPAIEAKLKANERLLARTGFGGVPLMLFYSKDGTPILIQGAPPANKLPLIFTSVK
jgi:thiol:disulfide interchange protein DsbG